MINHNHNHNHNNNKKKTQTIKDYLHSFFGINHIIQTLSEVESADMQKDTIFTPTSLVPKLFYPKKCVNYDKTLFLTKLRKRSKRPKKCKEGHKVTYS